MSEGILFFHIFLEYQVFGTGKPARFFLVNNGNDWYMQKLTVTINVSNIFQIFIKADLILENNDIGSVYLKRQKLP